MYNLHMQQQQQQQNIPQREKKNFKQAKMKFMLHHRNFNGGGRHPTVLGLGLCLGLGLPQVAAFFTTLIIAHGSPTVVLALLLLLFKLFKVPQSALG